MTSATIEHAAPQVRGSSPGSGARRLQLERARIDDEALVFAGSAGLAKALGDGCFFLEIPGDLDLTPGITLARQFYLPQDAQDAQDAQAAQDGGDPATRAYRGFRERAGIYFDRAHFQTEHVLIDRAGRARHFAPELIAMCERMNELALFVLRRVLAALGIPIETWDLITGGAVNNHGTHWFASSHYRTELDLLGCAPHKDTGFVTVLYIEDEGLETWCDGDWTSIDPLPGHLVINFGGALEILTRHMRTPVRAIFHRVRQIPRVLGRPDRFSFAAFANPPAVGMLYTCNGDGAAKPYMTVEEFLVEFNKTTWNDRHDDFGIK